MSIENIEKESFQDALEETTKFEEEPEDIMDNLVHFKLEEKLELSKPLTSVSNMEGGKPNMDDSELFSIMNIKEEEVDKVEIKVETIKQECFEDVIKKETVKQEFIEAEIKNEIVKEEFFEGEIKRETVKQEFFNDIQIKVEQNQDNYENDLYLLSAMNIKKETEIEDNVKPGTSKMDIKPSIKRKPIKVEYDHEPQSKIKKEVLVDTNIKNEELDNTKIKKEELHNSKIKEEELDSTSIKQEVLDTTEINREEFDDIKVKEEFDDIKVKEEFDDIKVKEECHDTKDFKLISQAFYPKNWAPVLKNLKKIKDLEDNPADSKDSDIWDDDYTPKRKVKYIKETSKMIVEKFDGDVPKTIKELRTLKGIGPILAEKCLKAAWCEVIGNGVNKHVHRVSNRLGWIHTKIPDESRQELEKMIPREDRPEVKKLLVVFGEQICKPLEPQCDSCLNYKLCPFATKGLIRYL